MSSVHEIGLDDNLRDEKESRNRKVEMKGPRSIVWECSREPVVLPH